MTILAWLGLWVVISLCFAMIWMALRAPARVRYAHRTHEPDPIESQPAAVTVCKLCGPTAAAIKRSGFCWKCEPHVVTARTNYGHRERA